MKQLVMVVVLLALLAGGPVGAQQDTGDETTYFVAVLFPINVRASASTTGTVLGTLAPGDSIQVMGVVSGERFNESSRWYVVSYRNRIGYVHSSLLFNPSIPTVTPPPPALPPMSPPDSILQNDSQGDAAVEAVEIDPTMECDVESLLTELRAVMLDTASATEADQLEALSDIARDILIMEQVCAQNPPAEATETFDPEALG